MQPHGLRDGSGFCGANMHLLKNMDLQKQCIGRCPVRGEWPSYLEGLRGTDYLPM